METKETTSETKEPTTEANHVPRKLTLAQNTILTIKVLSVSALLMGALWAANQWTSGR